MTTKKTTKKGIPLPPKKAPHLTVLLNRVGGVEDRVHLLTVKEIHAVNAAMMAGRPLLVRGEPGTGKSQLALAAAISLNRAFVPHVIDSRTESRDLMWRFDAVRRLADAQLAGSLREDPEEARAALAEENYVQPGPLWWAFEPDSALQQCKKHSISTPHQDDEKVWANGSVVLLDEIDKAESETPNGLLEALGARSFTPQGWKQAIHAQGPSPLVIITTNEERALPDHFLRRCLVLHLGLPKDEKELKAFLLQRGEAHFKGVDKEILQKAADMLWDDREAALEAQITPRPGQAEYLDMIRAVIGMATTTAKQLELLNIVAPYTLKKNAHLDALG
ncbi:MAG: AAA family ATPase [Magnetococcales bacterium]|nr:AAA family ATPase [Magnetococcales bacterium]